MGRKQGKIVNLSLSPLRLHPSSIHTPLPPLTLPQAELLAAAASSPMFSVTALSSSSFLPQVQFLQALRLGGQAAALPLAAPAAGAAPSAVSSRVSSSSSSTAPAPATFHAFLAGAAAAAGGAATGVVICTATSAAPRAAVAAVGSLFFSVTLAAAPASQEGFAASMVVVVVAAASLPSAAAAAVTLTKPDRVSWLLTAAASAAEPCTMTFREPPFCSAFRRAAQGAVLQGKKKRKKHEGAQMAG